METIVGKDPSTQRNIEVQIKRGVITRVRDTQEDTDCWVTPGFVDLQVNGYRGQDLNADGLTPESVQHLTQLLAASGTTTYLPTVTTASQSSMLARVSAIAQACTQFLEVHDAAIGIHLEGPHISPLDGYRGAHPEADIRPPSLAEFDQLQVAAKGMIRMVTLSPHWPGSASFIRSLVAKDIVVAIGHTHASPQQIQDAVIAGATLSTHLGNGIAPLLARHPNPIWSQMANDQLTATFIADGVHLSPETLRVMLRAKTISRSILISDSVSLTGAAPGEYTSQIGGAVVVHPDGSIQMRNSNLLAGSGIVLKDAVARAPHLSGCTLAEAVQMATHNPSAVLGISSPSIAAESVANLLLFRWSEPDAAIKIVKVIAHGRPIHIA